MQKLIFIFSLVSLLGSFDAHAERRKCNDNARLPQASNLSAYATQGNSFDFSISFLDKLVQFVTFDKVEFDPQIFDFDCRVDPQAILLKKPGNYLVIFEGNRSNVFPNSFSIQFYLNDQPINTRTVTAIIHKVYLQNIIEVKKTDILPAVLKVGLNPQEIADRFGFEEETPALSAIYLSPPPQP